jgi:hypothetical protein
MFVIIDIYFMPVVSIIIQLYLVIAVGYLLAKIFKVDNKILTYFAVYFSLPCLMFYGVYTGGYDWKIIIMPAVYVLLNILVLVFAYLYAKIFRYNYEDQSIISVLSWAGNNANFGIPVIVALLGPAALPVTALMVLVNTVFMIGPGAYLFAREKGSFKKTCIKILKLPLIYAVALGLIFNIFKVHLPELVTGPIQLIGQALVPTQLILTGTFLVGLKYTKIDWKLITPSLVFKLIIMPWLGWLLIKLLGLPFDNNAYVMLIEAAAPFAVLTVSLADLY